MGVVLRFSSMASCADTRSGRVESPIRLFLTQQIASYGRAMGEGRGIFPLILVVCLLCVPGLLLGNFNQGIFEEERVFGSLGVRSVIGLPTGIIISSIPARAYILKEVGYSY